MAGTVSNGGIGKSPSIDKINQSNRSSTIETEISEKLEDLICKQENEIYPPVEISFAACKKELFHQTRKRK